MGWRNRMKMQNTECRMQNEGKTFILHYKKVGRAALGSSPFYLIFLPFRIASVSLSPW